MSERLRTINLDQLAARHAQAALDRTLSMKATAVDNLVTRTLGVLQENGLYACALFLKSRRKEESEHANAVLDEILTLLDELGRELHFGWEEKPASASPSVDEVLTCLTNTVTAHLERLLLAREILEQMLIYARYGAKGRGSE